MFLIGWFVGLILSFAVWLLGLLGLLGAFAVIYLGMIYPAWHTGWSFWWKFILYFLEMFITYLYTRGLAIQEAIKEATGAKKPSSYFRLFLSSLVGGAAGLGLVIWQLNHRSVIPWTLWLILVTQAMYVGPLSGMSMRMLAEREAREGKPPGWAGPLPEINGLYQLWRGFMTPVWAFATLFDNRFKKENPKMPLGDARVASVEETFKAGL